MIKFRQKEYSAWYVRAAKIARKSGNKALTAIDNAGLRVGDKIKETLTGRPSTFPKFRFQPKTDRVINRETLQQVKGIQGSINALASDPGGTAGELVNKHLIQRATRSPISAVMPFAPVPGTTTASVAIAPYEQRFWDMTGIGKATNPVKHYVRTTANRNAANIGRAAYDQLKHII